MKRLDANQIATLLRNAYPDHSDLFDSVGTLVRLEKRNIPVPEAVVRVVTGQMLSTAVARTIYGRVQECSYTKTNGKSWLLSYDDLRKCGLSNGKCKTITEFSLKYEEDKEPIDNWVHLTKEDLFRQVGAFWGMSTWTASILGLFYFANEDIFPMQDGTIRKAISILSEKNGMPPIDPEKVRRYRSYLALALWKAVDDGALF